MKLNKNIAVSESGFIFNPATGDSFSANAVGADIIQMMKEDKKKADIVKAIATKYKIESAAFEKDLEDFYIQLRDNNLTSYEG